MEKTEAAELNRLRELVERHEERITALEARLKPQKLSTAALDLLLAELAEQGGNYEA